MIFGMTLKKDYFDELERRLRYLKDKKVKVGMFDNTKREYSNWTNVSLFAYLSGGDVEKGLAPRPVLELAFKFSPLSKSPLKKELRKYLSNIKVKKSSVAADEILHSVGKFYRQETYNLFGNPSMLAPNTPVTVEWKERMGYKGQNPLIMTGEMRSKISYKIDAKVYEIGG